MTHPNLRIVLGPPGTGKTEKLLGLLENELSSGTRPDRVAFLAFTRKAAGEARERATKRFGLGADALPWFRTIHSLVFRRMGYRKQQVIGPAAFAELGEKLGVIFTGGVYSEDGMVNGLGTGDKLAFLDNLARVSRRDVVEIWEESDHGVDREELRMFAKAYRTFKDARLLVDYTDMLDEFVKERSTPRIEVLFVDEAQDLSRLQWEVVDAIAKGCRVVYVAGDDDQAIYRWAGADVDRFMRLRGRVEILEQSHRVGSAVHDTALDIVGRIARRTTKSFRPRAEAGSVSWVAQLDEVDLSATNLNEKGAPATWLLLARNSYMLRQLEDHCSWVGVDFDSAGRRTKKRALLDAIMIWERLRRGESLTASKVLTIARYFSSRGPFDRLRSSFELEDLISMDALDPSDRSIWHEAMDRFPEEERERFLSLRERGEKLLGPARVKVSTIHGVKGGEADNVLLLTDVSLAAKRGLDNRPDDEHRVFYVAVTRARTNLFVAAPRTNLCYEI